MKKIIFVILGILVIAGLAGGGYYLWQNQKQYPLVASLAEKIGVVAEKVGITQKPQWSIFPNYSSPSAVVQDGDTYWVGSSGGILRYDEKTKNMRFYNKSNGLLGNQIWSMIKVDDKLWFTLQGSGWTGTYGAGSGIQVIDMKSGDIVKTFPANSMVPLEIIDQFAPFGNPEIYQDPYDGSLWVGTMRGLYRYDGRAQKWNYMNATSPSMYDIYDVVFTKKEVFARTAGEGILYLDNIAGVINNISHEDGYLLSGNTDFLVSNSESAFVAGRAADYNSCADADKKEGIVEKYTVGSGWDKMDVLNGAIGYDEAIKSLVVKDDQLWIYILTNDCNSLRDKRQFFILKYDIAKNKIIERVRDAEDDKYMDIYSNLDQAKQEDYSAIAQKIEKETGVPAQKDVAFIDKNNRMLIQVGSINTKGNSYAYFDPKSNTYDFSLWDKIKAHKEVSESDFSFEFMSCNQYNDANDEDLVFIREAYQGMGGPTEESIYAYSKSKDSLEKYIFKIPVPPIPAPPDNYFPNPAGALVCNDKEFIYPSNKGIASLDWATKKETIYSDGFKPFISAGENVATQGNMDFFDGSKEYFLAEGAKIGGFDINTKKYSYDHGIPQDLSDGQGNSYHFSDHLEWYDQMFLTSVDDGKMYFYLNDESLDNNLPPRTRAVIVFDTKLNKWAVFSIDEKLSPRTDWISDVKFWNGKIWVTLSEAATLTIDATNGNQAIVGSKDGMLDEYGTILPHGDSIWFSGPGIWGLMK